MTHVRPYQIFDLCTDLEREVRLPLPKGPGIWGVKLLEAYLLIGAARAVKARRVWEFGTWRGNTTLALARNLDACVYTLDVALQSAYAWDCTAESARILSMVGNSLAFDFRNWKGSMNMVWIDGGHDLETVQADTVNAYKLLDDFRPGVIAWHDYQNPEFPELTAYLETLPGLVHVSDTWLALWFNELRYNSPA